MTIYLAVQLTLEIVTIVTTDPWDWFGTVQIVVELLIVAALWLPPGARYFRRVDTADAAVPATA